MVSLNTATRNKLGFTVIELLLVVALIGLLASFLIPRLNQIWQRQTLLTETESLMDTLSEAESIARAGLQSGTEFVEKYQLSLQDKNDNDYASYQLSRVSETSNLVLSAKQLQCPVCIKSSVQAFNFQVPSGLLQNDSLPIELKVCYPQTGYYTVTVNKEGQISRVGLQTGGCSCSINSCD